MAVGSETLPIKAAPDVVVTRQKVRAATITQGFSLIEQTKVITAASELARNTLDYGGGGEVIIELLEQSGKKGVRLSFVDRGPGIANMDLALTDGYTTGGGLGMGLTGARRLMNEFEIDSKVGEGTRVTVTKWK
ncbi:MAG: anti-sigma regulatory factor [Proteobacteria bacterium]|nr:MAG: anti-sigma regulatory factor [Pseudomonadota bacterium]RYZ71506.1 MAG: anti-sigma regulatory factor [Pseudomonadota bacterium]